MGILVDSGTTTNSSTGTSCIFFIFNIATWKTSHKQNWPFAKIPHLQNKQHLVHLDETGSQIITYANPKAQFANPRNLSNPPLEGIRNSPRSVQMRSRINILSFDPDL